MSKKKDNQKQSKFKKFLTIINPRTILGKCIILGTLIILGVLIWFITVTAISIDAFINTTADKVAFTDDEDVDLNNVTRVNDEDLTDFKTYLKCSSYNSNEKAAKFTLYLYQEQTQEDQEEIELKNGITYKLLITADYCANFDDDSDNPDYYNVKSSTKSSKTLPLVDEDGSVESDALSISVSFSSLTSLPSKTKTITLWPYSMKKVSKPIIYLYVSYTEKANNVSHNYLIRYEFNDVEFTGVIVL